MGKTMDAGLYLLMAKFGFPDLVLRTYGQMCTIERSRLLVYGKRHATATNVREADWYMKLQQNAARRYDKWRELMLQSTKKSDT